MRLPQAARPPLALALVLAACASPAPRPQSPPPPPAPPPAVVAPPPEVAPPRPAAPPPHPVDARTARLVRLCHLWGRVRYLDPLVVQGDVDWDAALIGALPKALAAQTDDDAAAAARVMLGALHDPASRVEHPMPNPNAEAVTTGSHTVDGVLVVRIGAANWLEMQKVAPAVEKDLATAKVAVLDVRAATPALGEMAQRAFDELAPYVVSHEATGLSGLQVEHRGYRTQQGLSSGGYGTWITRNLPRGYAPSTLPHPSRVVVLTNTATGVPDLAWAMQRAGDAVIAVQGRLPPDAFADTEPVGLAGGHVAYVRVSELVGPAPRADLELDAATSDDKAEAAAVQAAKRPAPRPRQGAKAAPERVVAWHADKTYPEAAYPSRELRMLALFRFWSVIQYFYPYLGLMGDAWDDALADFIPRFEGAGDAREYATAAEELAARIPDGHVNVSGGKVLEALRGPATVPFAVRVLSGQAVVTTLGEDAPVSAAGVAVGDVVVAVDGEPMDARIARARTRISASNDATGARWGASAALRGDKGSKAALTLRGADGAPRTVTATRSTRWVPEKRTGPVFRLLPGGDIGYVDLDRLEVGEVDSMFAAFEKTKGIVLDMRGYPHGTAWSIAPRLNVRHAKKFAAFYEPLVSPSTSSSFFEQGLAPADKPLYEGKTVMLIDERTMSQAEHSGLFYEVANGTKFIGSQTAGANGDVTTLSLPGELYVSFTGHDVRHIDGRQLQRVGLVPDVEVHPTIEGIRAGRDEVLDRAALYLRTGK